MFRIFYQYIIITKSGLFNKEFYLATYSDIKEAKINPLCHFIKYGWKEGKNPSPDFNTHFYLNRYPDVKETGINPLIHYIRHGKEEGRLAIKETDSYNMKNWSGSKTIGDAIENKTTFNPNLNSFITTTDLTIYFHIGQGKTGTSTLQKFMDVNRRKLFKELGYLYPNFNSDNLISGTSNNHAMWYQSVKHNKEKLTFDIKRMLKFAAENSIDKIILSNEEWELDENSLNLARTILDIDSNIHCKAICYLRRIDTWVESAWKQWGLKIYDSIDDYYKRSEFLNRYRNTLKQLDAWENLIGLENIIVRPYEKQQLCNGLLFDFLATVGIDFTSYEWDLRQVKGASNPGYNRDVLEILHICRDLNSDVRDNHLFALFSSLLGEQFQKKPFESYALLSPEQKLEILKQNLPYENKIGKKYLDRPDGKIFYDPWPDPNDPWEPYRGLTLEKALPILIKMIEHNHKLVK